MPIAALVDGQPIALADLDSQVAQYRQALLDQGLDLATSDGQAQLAAARQDVLEAMIDQVLIEQRAVTMGITVSSSDIEADLSQAISAGGGQAAFDGWLSSTAQTRQEFGLLLGRSLLQQRVFEAVTSDISDHAEQVHLRQIEVATEQAALEIVALIRAGSDFASLAQERSTNAATAGAGGDLGWFPHGLLAPELEAPAFFLRPGDVGEPVRVGDSYCVIQVVERDPARPLAPEHHLALKQAAFDRWLDAQRSKAVIQRLVGQ